jgi:lipopolysaccharide transport system ATP-binding protein
VGGAGRNQVRQRGITYSPLPSQKRFHESAARFKGFSGPIGSGKSQALCQEALKLTYLNPGRTGLIGAPTYPMLRDATQAGLIEILERNKIPHEWNRAENFLVLRETRSRILFRAVEEFERLRGSNLAWFGLDELTYTSEGAWLRLEGRLRDPKAARLCGFAVWTPKGYDWVCASAPGESPPKCPHWRLINWGLLQVQNVSKVFHLYRRPADRLLEAVPFIKHAVPAEFWALRDVNLNVERGEVLGVVGPNGSGKSTLLQIVSGILEPTRGQVVTQGRIAALLELGAGFNPEFTGRENVFLNGEILGMPRKEMARVYPEIERFAEIGAFIDRPVKEYSSGMYVRLAFATAIHVEPEILIVDEALAVGDAIFANRCIRKFDELKRRRVTVLFVSHDLGLVKRLSDRAALLWEGRVAACGNPGEVVNRYIGLVLERQKREGPERDAAQGGSFRHGDGASRVTEVELLDAQGKRTRSAEPGAPLTIRVRARAEKDLIDPVVGVLIRNRLGIDVFGTNTRIEGIDLGTVAENEAFEVEFTFDCLLTGQDYTVTAATQYREGYSQDWLDDALSFSVVDSRDIAGLANFKTKVNWRKRA